MSRTILLFLVLLLPATAAPIPKLAKKPSYDGRWEIVELYVGEADVTQLYPVVWEISGEELVIYRRDERKNLRLDDTSVRKTLTRPNGADGSIDYNRTTGEDVLVLKGLIKVEGDSFEICFANENTDDRPTEVKKHKQFTWMRFKRQEK